MNRKNAIILFLLNIFSMSYSYAQPQVQPLAVDYYTVMRDYEEQAIPDVRVFELICDGVHSSFCLSADSCNWNARSFSVFKELSQKGELVYIDRIEENGYYYKENMPTFDWKMQDGDTIVCSYPCQKAKTVFRGREWNVWYAIDLPYSDGPWKLSGLPGLILLAQDAKGDFRFVAQKIAMSDKEVPTYDVRQMRKTTAKCFAEDRMDAAKNPSLMSAFLSGRKPKFGMDGTLLPPEPQTACLLEYFGQKSKKK